MFWMEPQTDLPCPGLQSQFDWELNAKRAKLRTLGNLSGPLKMVRKTENSKGLQGTLPMLLVPECLQKLASDPTAVTKYVHKKSTKYI